MQKQRLLSIDVLRGFTIALMIVVNNPGSWANIFPPLAHASWHGITPTDWVFPFFLGISGMSIGLVKPRLDTLSDTHFFQKIAVRAGLIFLCGLVLNAAPFVQYAGENLIWKSLENLRIMGVLQRIAVCFFFVSVMTRYMQIAWLNYFTAFLLIVYWWMCIYFSTSQDGDVYSLASYFGTSWDVAIFGESHLYQGEGVAFDPEGIASTLPAIASTLLGFLSFHYVRRHQQSPRKLAYILLIAIACVFFSYYGWDDIFPINKKIWTSSYVMYTSSLCLIFLIVLHVLLDTHILEKFTALRGLISPFAFFFKVLGMNAIFIYVLSGMLVRCMSLIRWKQPSPLDPTMQILYTPWKYLYECVFLPMMSDPKWASLCCAMLMLALMWIISWLLYVRKIFVKI